MIMNLLSGNLSIQTAVLWVIALVIAFTVHEMSHGFAALLLGDKTAKYDGRLSFNPLKHIDPIGFVLILVAGFGWAKPVMVNPRNLKYPKQDFAFISIAGPFSNFLMAFIAALILAASGINIFSSGTMQVVGAFLQVFMVINISLGIFNLIPIPPLDGSKFIGAILPDRLYNAYMSIGRYGMMILIIIIVFSDAASGFLGNMQGAVYSWMMTLAFKIF